MKGISVSSEINAPGASQSGDVDAGKDRPLRVGSIYTLYGRRAGAELFAERIFRGLADRSGEIELVIYCNREAQDVLDNRFPGVENHVVPQLESQLKKAYWLEFLSHKTVNKAGLDVFWIPSGTNSFPGRWAVPSVVTFLDLGEYFVKSKYDLKRSIYRKMVCIPRSIKRATAFTAISHTTADDVQKLFNVTQRPEAIWLGPSPRESNDRRDEGMTPEEEQHIGQLNDYFFCPGRTDHEGKGLDVLLKGYRLFAENTPEPPQLVLVGPKGEHHERVIADIERFELNHLVKYLGRVSDAAMEHLYGNCRAVVIASRYEGFGFPVLEAMQHKAPVICSRAGALPEVGGDAVVSFESGDEAELALCLKRVVQDTELADKMVELGLERLKQFSWDNTIAQMCGVFYKAAGTKCG